MKLYRFALISLSLLASSAWTGLSAAEDVYGPVNLLKTFSTPFNAPAKSSDSQPAQGPGSNASNPFRNPPVRAASTGSSNSSSDFELLSSPSVISITAPARAPVRSLSDRLLQSRLYLPGRLVIGRTAEFTIKGRPGYFVALAMADKDTGAKDIFGHKLRLGPDRKLVSLGQIPADGVLQLTIETPIEGDLIGLPLFFEAAIWSRPDFSDLEIATPVSSEGQVGVKNGVLVAAEPESKRGIKFVPETTMPSLQIAKPATGLDPNRP